MPPSFPFTTSSDGLRESRAAAAGTCVEACPRGNLPKATARSSSSSLADCIECRDVRGSPETFRAHAYGALTNGASRASSGTRGSPEAHHLAATRTSSLPRSATFAKTRRTSTAAPAFNALAVAGVTGPGVTLASTPSCSSNQDDNADSAFPYQMRTLDRSQADFAHKQ